MATRMPAGRRERTLIDGYDAFEAIGSGGMSTVYRAHQERFDRTVAVKVLNLSQLSPKTQERFRLECRRTGRVSVHPHVLTVLDSGFTVDGHPYITTDFMVGGSLADRVRSAGPLPVDDVLAIGIKLCGALETVHRAGIVHRDVKPENVLLSEFGEPVLADFGIAAVADVGVSSTRTVALTPVHAAPEILEGNHASSFSDVYALGSTLYALLCGDAPFQGPVDEGLAPLIRRILDEPPPPIAEPAVGAALQAVLERALAKEPEQRYPSAAALGAALQREQERRGSPVTELVVPAAGAGDHGDQDDPGDEIGAAAAALVAWTAGRWTREPSSAASPRRALLLTAAVIVALLLLAGITGRIRSLTSAPTPSDVAAADVAATSATGSGALGADGTSGEGPGTGAPSAGGGNEAGGGTTGGEGPPARVEGVQESAAPGDGVPITTPDGVVVTAPDGTPITTRSAGAGNGPSTTSGASTTTPSNATPTTAGRTQTTVAPGTPSTTRGGVTTTVATGVTTTRAPTPTPSPTTGPTTAPTTAPAPAAITATPASGSATVMVGGAITITLTNTGGRSAPYSLATTANLTIAAGATGTVPAHGTVKITVQRHGGLLGTPLLIAQRVTGSINGAAYTLSVTGT